MVPVHHSWLWFPKFSGLTSGIIIGGFGFGALIFNNVSTSLINPSNLPFDEETLQYPKEVNDNFTKMFRTLILLWTICVVLGAVMVFKGPAPDPLDIRFEESDAEHPPHPKADKYKVEEGEDEAAKEEKPEAKEE